MPVVPWDDFMGEHFVWQQGEHVTLLGPTGTGKTTAAIQLLERRGYKVAIGTKPRDNTLDYLRKHRGYKVVKELPRDVRRPTSVIVWPKMRTLDRARKRELAGVVRSTLDRAYSAGGWTIFADELSFLSNTLRLAPELTDIWQQGRSNNVSLVGCSQRPRWIPLDAYSAASHVFLWRTSDRGDLKRLSEMNGVNTDAIRRIVPELPAHHVLYVSTRDARMVVTLAPRIS